MAVYLRRFKKTENTNECDGAAPAAPMCEQPFTSGATGIGNAIPLQSGDRWDNVLGAGFIGTVGYPVKKKRYKIKKRKK